MLSATLQPHQRLYLEGGRKLDRIVDERKNEKGEVVPTPADLKRYRIHVVSRQEALTKFGPGALWVANTRPEVQDLADRFKSAMVLHSSLKYQQRCDKQLKLVNGFDRPGKRQTDPMCAITTQIAEMSLDISARVLISSIAPIHSLIQRMGRLARFIQDESDSHFQKAGEGEAYFYMPESGMPYELGKTWQAKFDSYKVWLQKFDDGEWHSQRELEAAFRAILNSKRISQRQTALFKTNRVSLRDVMGSITGVMEDDVAGLGPDPWNSKVQLVEIPAYLNQEEHQACSALPPIKGRVVFPKKYFKYDERLGLIHLLRKSA
jgi:hypothetical protein